MSVLPVPVVSVVIGEGGSGPALALGVADRILMQEHAVYSVIAPEGAAAIVHRDAARAQEIADALKMTAYDCQVLGVVDAVVPEPENGAHADPEYAALLLRGEIVSALVELRRRDARRLVEERWRKFRRMGEFQRIVEASAGQGQRAEAMRTALRRARGSLAQLRERWPPAGRRSRHRPGRRWTSVRTLASHCSRNSVKGHAIEQQVGHRLEAVGARGHDHSARSHAIHLGLVDTWRR